MSKFCSLCSQPYHPIFHDHPVRQDTSVITVADFITIIIPPVAPRERKLRENPAAFGGLAVDRERHATKGGRGVVGRLYD